jgi:hypothetical protein
MRSNAPNEWTPPEVYAATHAIVRRLAARHDLAPASRLRLELGGTHLVDVFANDPAAHNDLADAVSDRSYVCGSRRLSLRDLRDMRDEFLAGGDDATRSIAERDADRVRWWIVECVATGQDLPPFRLRDDRNDDFFVTNLARLIDGVGPPHINIDDDDDDRHIMSDYDVGPRISDDDV